MIGNGAHRRQEQLAAEPACSRRVTVPTKPGEDGYSRQVGEVTTRRVKWAWVAGLSGPVMAYHPWVDAPTPRVHPPCGSSTRSSRQARDRLTGRYWHHFPMSPWRLLSGKASDSGGAWCFHAMSRESRTSPYANNAGTTNGGAQRRPLIPLG